MKLTQEQRGEVIVEEAEYQLTVMIQYLSDDQKRLYVAMLHRYQNMLPFSQFIEKHNLQEFMDIPACGNCGVICGRI